MQYLEIRWQESVVDHQKDVTPFVYEFSDFLNIDNFQSRIGGCFNPNQLKQITILKFSHYSFA